MTELPTPIEPPTPAGPPTPPPSLSPKPGSLAIAFLLVGVLFYNLYLDAQGGDYDGKYLTFGVIALIAGILGVDISRFWRGKDQ